MKGKDQAQGPEGVVDPADLFDMDDVNLRTGLRVHVRRPDNPAWRQIVNEATEPGNCPTGSCRLNEKLFPTAPGGAGRTEAPALPRRCKCPYGIHEPLVPFQTYIYLPKAGLRRIELFDLYKIGPLGRNGDDFLGQREAAPTDDQAD